MKRKDNDPAEPLKLPLYALPASRSISAPSVLLNPTQSRMVKRKIAFHHGVSAKSEREIYERVMATLIEFGWSRVEFHGDCIFLTAVIHHEAHKNLIEGYREWAKSTGIWSIMDYIRWGRKRPVLKSV